MGTQVGRIEKEFVFKALIDDAAPCDVHGMGKEANCRFSHVSDERLEMVPLEGRSCRVSRSVRRSASSST